MSKNKPINDLFYQTKSNKESSFPRNNFFGK